MSIRVVVKYNGKDITTYDATSYPITVTYNNNTIATINSDSTKTLNCEGTYANSNIKIGTKTLNCANKRMLTNVVVTTEDNGTDATIIIDNDGNSSNCFVTINGTKYYQGATLTLVRGTEIVCSVRGYNSSYPGTVTVNGNVVYSRTANSVGTYTYILPKGLKTVRINFETNTYTSGKSSYNYYSISIDEEK